MSCCNQCAGLERLFDERLAQNELRDYHRHGPAPTTRMLLYALKTHRLNGLSLLGIGGGIGAIQHDLLQAGVEQATQVDASQAYLRVARSEAERLNHGERARFQHGDFVALAPQIEAADIVTLDRVVCCYPDVEALISRSAEHTRRYYGLVFPRDYALLRVIRPVFNLYFRIRRNPYRFFVHPTTAIDSILEGQGLRRIFRQTTRFWQVIVYERG